MSTTELQTVTTPRLSIRRFLQQPARLILRLLGWRIANDPPDIPRYVLIGAHHTANFDGILLLLVGTALQMRVNFLMKDSLFRGIMGPVARRLGGIAIDRSTRHNVVDQIAGLMQSQPRMVIAIAPEGTRRKVPYWRSGFYHIARAADVPLVLAYADYQRKVVGFGPVLDLTGDVTADMDKIRAFYADIIPRHPEKISPVMLRSELPDEAAD
jgi:1-acyl-sn-glycerol-3-phosphate acyltransferase